MAKSGQSSKSPDCICLIISVIRLGDVLDIVKVLKFALLRYDTFPPGPAGAPDPQASLAALAIPSPGESAGFFGENGSLSPVAGRGTGSIGLSGCTCRFHLRESAGFFRENGSLSPAAGRGTGTIDLSRGTWHFHPWGKCRVFPRKRFTFPRGMRLQGGPAGPAWESA